LLDRGADVDARGYRGTFALLSSFDSCGEDRTAITTMLLQAGADVNVADFAHETPLIKACSRSAGLDRVRMLIAAGADVNAVGRYGMTPLHLAAMHRIEVVAALLAAGAEKDVLDDQKRRPYDMASSPAVKELLRWR
jgi:ankyrin repeat protein